MREVLILEPDYETNELTFGLSRVLLINYKLTLELSRVLTDGLMKILSGISCIPRAFRTSSGQ